MQRKTINLNWHFELSFLLQPMLDSFDTDWGIDNEELSEYLSNIIGKKFKLPQKALEPYEIVERLEKKSDYTLLNIETEQDSYSLFVCKQKIKTYFTASKNVRFCYCSF